MTTKATRTQLKEALAAEIVASEQRVEELEDTIEVARVERNNLRVQIKLLQKTMEGFK